MLLINNGDPGDCGGDGGIVGLDGDIDVVSSLVLEDGDRFDGLLISWNKSANVEGGGNDEMVGNIDFLLILIDARFLFDAGISTFFFLDVILYMMIIVIILVIEVIVPS